MAITTSLQTKYTAQRIFMVVVCLVMGLWGVYDYFVGIPGKARAYERSQVYETVHQALSAEPGQPETPELIAAAKTRLEEEITSIAQSGRTDGGTGPMSPEMATEAFRRGADPAWRESLQKFSVAVLAAQRRRPGTLVSEDYMAARDLAEAGLNETKGITPPSTFDHVMQLGFIACLPFVPWLLWTFARERRLRYRLDDDGTFHAPGEIVWPKDEIADIDMSRWMSKSIATVVHTDGAQIKLDDYVHRHVDEIVGVIASERYPDEWTAEAKPVKRDRDDEDGGDAEAEASADEPAATPADADDDASRSPRQAAGNAV